MKKKQKKIIYCQFGLANSYFDRIELNYKLKDKERLRDYLIKHEQGHIDSFDLPHEFNIDWKMMPSLLWFVFTTPSSWVDFLPVQIKNKRLIYDLNMLILYSIIIIIIAGYFVSKRFI